MAKKNFSDPKALDGMIQNSTGADIPSGVTNIDAPKPVSSNIKDVDVPKAAVNTTKAAEAVAAGSGSTGVAATYGRSGAGVVFSGGAGAISGDMSATVKGTHQYRSGDRTGRRADPITRKIDLLNSEIVEDTITQSKPLAETDAKQGYNGNYHNQHARTQKANGASPADPMFMRSLDEISMDMIYYPAGQQLPMKGFVDYDIHTFNPAADSYADDAIPAKSGNFVGRYLEFDVDNDGITNFRITTDNLTPTKELDEPTYRAASDALLRNINSAELDRAKIIEQSGNENLDGWSPLGLTLSYSSDQIRFLREFEASIGDIVQLSRRKLATALSYQINKTAKDGSRLSGPIAEMCNGLVSNDAKIGLDTVIGNVDFVAGDGRAVSIDNPEVMRKGSAALYVAMNDSTPKYNTKGKFLTLPLSFRAALTAAKASCAPLRTHADFETMLAKNELFSTIDGPYDGVKPIVVTNGAAIALPVDVYNLGNAEGNADHKFPIYTMHYENLRNKYNIPIRNYFLSGLYKYLNNRRANIVKALGTAEKHVKIPIVSSTTSISLWDLLVCAATPHIVEDRIVTMTVLLQYESQHGYPFSNSVSLDQVDVCKAENFSFTSEDEMLVSAIAKPVAAMKVIMPEVFWPVAKMKCEMHGGHTGVAAKTVLPHYFVQNQFNAVFHHGDMDDAKNTAETLILSEDFGTMAYPSTRSGSRYGFLDTVYGMSEEDYRLSLDRMVTWPGAMRVTNDYAGPIAGYNSNNKKFQTLPFCVYKYGMTADGQPVIPYVAYADKEEDKGQTLTIFDILTTPRELGLMQVAPAGYLTPVRRADHPTGGHTLEVTSAYLGTSGPGFKFKIYRAEATTVRNAAQTLNDGATSIGFEQSVRGIWHSYACIPTDAGFDQGWAFNATVGFENTFVPFTLGGMDGSQFDFESGQYANFEEAVGDMPLHAPHKYYWTRLQRMPFAINPVDANAANLTTAESSTTLEMINDVDIFDFLYTFGLCGFRASDYMELIYDRSKEKITLGMNYVADPFVSKSMLLK